MLHYIRPSASAPDLAAWRRKWDAAFERQKDDRGVFCPLILEDQGHRIGQIIFDGQLKTPSGTMRDWRFGIEYEATGQNPPPDARVYLVRYIWRRADKSESLIYSRCYGISYTVAELQRVERQPGSLIMDVRRIPGLRSDYRDQWEETRVEYERRVAKGWSRIMGHSASRLDLLEEAAQC